MGAGAGAVDFVGHEQLAEHGSWHEAEAAGAIGGGILGFKAGDFRRHEVGGELDAFGVKAEHGCQRFDQFAFAEAGHADQQHVAAGEQADQGLFDDAVLAMDGVGDFAADIGEFAPDLFYCGQDIIVRGGWCDEGGHRRNPCGGWKGKCDRARKTHLSHGVVHANSVEVGMLAAFAHPATGNFLVCARRMQRG